MRIPRGICSCTTELPLKPPRYQKQTLSKWGSFTSQQGSDRRNTVKRGWNPHSRLTEVKWNLYLLPEDALFIKGICLNANSILSIKELLAIFSLLTWAPVSDGTPGSGHLLLKTSPNSVSSVSLFRFSEGVLAQQEFHLIFYQLFFLSSPSGNPYFSAMLTVVKLSLKYFLREKFYTTIT